jgi:transketolase
VYIRLSRPKTPVVTTEQTPFEIGKGYVVFEPDNPQAGIVVTGTILYNVLMVARELQSEGVNISVFHLPTIKPLDEEGLLKFAERSRGRIVTVEEHQIIGGMGSAVAECLAKTYPSHIEFVGVKNAFGQSGKPEELLAFYGLDKESIKSAVRKILSR